MLPRFLAAIDASSGTARLDADETRHLSQVLRLAAGDEVAVFDGEGHEYRARVDRIARHADAVRVDPVPPSGSGWLLNRLSPAERTMLLDGDDQGFLSSALRAARNGEE